MWCPNDVQITSILGLMDLKMSFDTLFRHHFDIIPKHFDPRWSLIIYKDT